MAFKIYGKNKNKIYLNTTENTIPHFYGNNSISYRNPLVVLVALIVVAIFFICRPADKPFLAFVSAWCLFQAGAVLINMREQMAFYRWWEQSGLSDSSVRGFGTNGFGLFGMIHLPKLSASSLKAVSLSYACMLVVVAGLCHKPFVGPLFIVTTILAMLYFSSLWSERNTSYHREYMSLAVLFYFCFTPDFYGLKNSSDAIIIVIKIHITSIYMAGAVQKIVCSFMAKRPWFSCSPHAFMWRAMWAKPYHHKIQRFFFLHPEVMAVGGLFVLLLESLFFMHFLAPHHIQIAMVASMIAFHAVVFVLQGIDYLTFWNPVFLLWFMVPSHADFSLAFNSWYLLPAALFGAAQLLYAFSFIEDLNINIPPFTCCPMFVNACRFNEPIAQYYCLWDLGSPIAWERLEWVYPFVKVESGLGMVESDMGKLPFRFLGFGYYFEPRNLPALQATWFRRDLIEEEGFFLYANYEADPRLVDRLATFVDWLHAHNSSRSIFDRAFLKEVIERQEACYAHFLEDIRRDQKTVTGEQYVEAPPIIFGQLPMPR